MTGLRHKALKNRTVAVLIAALAAFAFSQILIAGHTAKYGEGPHKHDGQVCVLSLAHHAGDKMLPAAAFVFAVFVAVWRAGGLAAQTERAAIAVRAAHPRGPPSF